MDKITQFKKAFEDKGIVLEDERFTKYTSLGVGGSIRLVFFPHTVADAVAAFQYVRKEAILYKIVGKGSNLLPTDDAFHGIILNLTKMKDKFEQVSATRFTIGAGYALQPLSRFLAKEGYTGHEFLAGIPGTIGGAIIMNAGTPEGEIKDVLIQATIVDATGAIVNISNAELQFGYRSSSLQERADCLILAGDFYFEKEQVSGASLQNIKDAKILRKAKQPIELPTCGSVFRNPEGNHSGALIEQVGLKGYRIGDAQVSEKHANFIINRGHASAADVRRLIVYIQETVEKETGIHLRPEVEFM